MSEGRTSEACDKFEASQRVDPAAGTLLNLAVCHEQIGRTATAWAEFREARERAQRDGRNDRVLLATEHARVLEAKLSRLAVSVPAQADLPNLAIRCDDRALPRGDWGSLRPVDPGEHWIEVSAPGRTSRRSRVQIGAEADLQIFTVEPLEQSTIRDPLASLPIQRASLASSYAGNANVTDMARSRHRTTLALALAAGGLTASGLAGYFGILAIRDRRRSDAECQFERCSRLGVSLNDHAKVAADVSTVGFTIGFASLAAAGYIVLSTGRPSSPKTGVQLFPSLTTRGGMLALTGEY